jgi:hypothetical protein
MMSRIGRVVVALLLLFTGGASSLASAGEPTGFRDFAWGSPWDIARFRSLPGCETQGTVVGFAGGVLAEFVHPECVNYRMADGVHVNLLLTYPDVKASALEVSQITLRSLVFQRAWGLSAAQRSTAHLQLIEVDRLMSLRRLNGEDGRLFPDMADRRPSGLSGLQAYQINFAHGDFPKIRAAFLERLGAPSTAIAENLQSLGGATFSGTRMIWSGEQTIAILREYGSTVNAGYLAVTTRAYFDALNAKAAATGRELQRGF